MIFGNKYNAAAGASGGNYFQIGRVKSIVMGPLKPGTDEPDPDYSNWTDIGKIRYESLYSEQALAASGESSRPAYPIFSFVKHLPTINEIVLIMVGPTEELNDSINRQRQYYFPAYDLWNNPNHGAFPNMDEYAEFLSQFINLPTYSGNAVTGSLPLGYTFTENANVKTLQPFEGDTILQARFGQSIRFGSTNALDKQTTWSSSGNNGDPITIILNSQGKRLLKDPFGPIVEDINKDGSAIYLTSTQEINLIDINNFPLDSFGMSANSNSNQSITELQKHPSSNEVISAELQDKNTRR